MRTIYNSNLLDMFDLDLFDAIGHQANCYKTMGAGIAKAIKQRYPEVYEADINFPQQQGLTRLGKYSVANTKHGLVVNLYGQLGWRKGTFPNTDVKALKDALFSFVEDNISDETMLLGLPYKIGAGLGGGDWDEIETAILEVDNSFPTLEIVFVSLSEAK